MPPPRAEEASPPTLASVGGRVGRQSLPYTLSAAVGPAAGVLLLPLYTRYLTPADYGLIALLEVVSLILTTVFSLGLTAMIPFYYVDLPAGRARRRGVGTVLVATTLINLALFLAVAFWGGGPARLLVPSVEFWPYVPLLAATALCEPYWIAAGSIFQIQERAVTYSIWSTTRIVLGVVLKVVFVVVLGQGVFGWVVASLLVAALVGASALPVLWREMEPALDASELRRALAVGGPTVPNNLLTYGFRVSDRLILDRFVEPGQIGLYYMALKIGDVVRLGTDVFMSAWRPVFFKEAGNTQFTSETGPAITRLVSVGLIGGCLALSLFARELVGLLMDPAYLGAAALVPLVVAAMAVKGLYGFPYLAIWYRKRTWLVPVLSAVTMAASIGGNLWLVPRWGVWAAAATLLGSYLLLLGLVHATASRLLPMHYAWRVVIPVAAVACGAAAIGSRLDPGAASFGIKVLLLGGFGAVAFLAGAVQAREIAPLVRLLKKSAPAAAVEVR